MNISKLTITPIFSKTEGIVINNPTTERATMLIKDKLACRLDSSKSIKLRMPKFLRGFVNPKSYVGPSIDIYR